MYIIGLTGGIGSGKTLVSKVFENLGIAVYNSDIEAKLLMNNNPEIINKFKMIFGFEIYDDNNRLNKKKLADLIFNDKNKLKTVNSIVHPAVKKHFTNWVQMQKSPYVIKETAILFESGTYKDVDKIITVTASLDLRINRLIGRDRLSKEAIIERVNNQLNEDYKIKNSDYVIYNDNKQLIVPLILKIHQKILEILKKK
ncbi:MAG: dephospho-CoA kinase [Bacteroidetes bacterium]|nr:MAG: dephospho-CoA kinase [Bacteroidota bacterium]